MTQPGQYVHIPLEKEKKTAAGVYRVLHNTGDFNPRFDLEIWRFDITVLTHRFSQLWLLGDVQSESFELLLIISFT